MPIPSLSSALKSRSQISRPKDTPSRSDGRNAPRHNPAENDALTSLPRPTSSSSASPTPNNGSVTRRSFLPQRGLAKSHLPSAGTDSPTPKLPPPQPESSQPKPSNAPAAPTLRQRDASSVQARPRPRSIYQSKPAAPSADAPAETVTKPLRSAGLRSQMPPPPVPNRTHTRTRSTNVAPAGVRKISGEVRPRAERPKSMVIPSNTVKAVASQTSTTRTAAKTGGLTRTASTRARPEASRDRAATVGAADSESGRSREAAKEESKKSARPAFSTLQQHFTPRKTGKAPTSTFLHPAPEPASQHLPPEIIALQAELLQLHLLHQASTQTSKKWERSAQQLLRIKFDEVASLYQVMREHERQGLEQKNILALREWKGANSTHTGLAAHIHALSGPLNELPSLLDSGGRYDRLAHDFQLWLSHVEAVFSLRNNPHQTGSRDLGSIEGLGDWWKEENAVLTRKLTALLRDLDQLSPPAPGSSIAAIVNMCKELLVGLVEELRVMQVLERDVVESEKVWVEERLRGIARDIDSRLDGGEVAAWRV